MTDESTTNNESDDGPRDADVAAARSAFIEFSFHGGAQGPGTDNTSAATDADTMANPAPTNQDVPAAAVGGENANTNTNRPPGAMPGAPPGRFFVGRGHPHHHRGGRGPMRGGPRDLRGGRFGPPHQRIHIRLDGRGGRGGRFPIRATVNGRAHPAVRVNFHGPNHNNRPAFNTGNNNNNPQQPRRHGPHPHHQVHIGNRLPRLQPQVVPETGQQFSSNNEGGSINDSDVDDAFKCSICYDIMNDPVGCGKCAARFCFACLRRVTELALIQQQQQQLQQGLPPGTNNNPPRCPVCRSEIADPEDIEHDANLRGRIEQLPPIPCRYQGCPEMIRIHHIGNHENVCPHVKVQCRYQSFGCQWTGKRGDLSAHEQNDCHLSRVSELVERFRETQIRMAHLHQTVMANGSMMELQRIRMQRESNQVSIGNLFHHIQFVHMLTCCTPRFLLSKDIWASFHADPMGRAVVANFCTLLPTAIVTVKTMAAFYRQMIVASHHLHESEDRLFDFVDGLSLLLILGCLAIIIGIGLFADPAAPHVWQTLALPWPQRLGGAQRLGSTHMIQYIVTIAMLGTHACALDSATNTFRATLMWAWLCLTSTFFPAVIVFMTMATNGMPSAVNDQSAQIVFQAGRAVRPLWFSFCYAFPCLAFGVLPCLDAAVLLYVGREFVKRVLLVERVLQVGEGETFGNVFTNVPLPAFYVYIGARAAMRANEFPRVEWMQSFDFVAVAILVITTKCLLWRTIKAATQVGLYIMNQARMRSSPLRSETSGCGTAMFTIWCLLLGALVVT
ncbi:TRAF-type zinc finger [Seminavis robusta]|uniref:TRAF-type zinc finger n=1 Tax=Seminavis robusta TaxID=568900 RepID=A0A9N8H791_9STRA|nr:TRAF-type zinc finger [Seminavis robusta]|eukprot:Sro63_g035800.1 TRAF-type zinc finger (786) ;mRNA; f:62729-65086